MDGERSAGHQPKPKFSVYQNPAFSATLTSKSLQPSASAFLFAAGLASVSLVGLAAVTVRADGLTGYFEQILLSENIAQLTVKVLQTLMGLVFAASLAALIRMFTVKSPKGAVTPSKVTPSKTLEKDKPLADRQSGYSRFQLRQEGQADAIPATRIPQTPRPVSSASEPLVPIQKSAHSHSPANQMWLGFGHQNMNAEKKALSPLSPPYASSPGTSWSLQSPSSGRKIETEEMLEQFLADVNEKMESAAKAAVTPPPTIRGVSITSPIAVGNSATGSGATRSAPLRPVRMSPGSHPKKGDSELPFPMSLEQMIEAYKTMGIYPQIEKWRDRLRQWFSSVLLKPLVDKIETSHIQVMQAAANLGISISVNQVGTDSLTSPASVNVSPIDGSKEWQPTFTVDEDGMLNQLRTTLMQARDRTLAQMAQTGVLGSQTNPSVTLMQTCISAITEHERLNLLMKGELMKGLLHQRSSRADYAVQRVRELAEGTCLKKYEYAINEEVFDNVHKKWTPDLPSDSHLVAYLFCAFLDHPKWMLHVDPASYSSNQSSKNPLFLGCIPPKERFPEKYVAILSGVPSYFHPGACILVIGKQNSPLFTLYWDKKLQFSLQGRTALWDAVLLLCHRIKMAYGGVVRGLHLGSAAFNILPVIESESDC